MTALYFAISSATTSVLHLAVCSYGGPTLNARAPESRVPIGLQYSDLVDWLKTQEDQLPIVAGAESRILLAGPSKDGNGLNPKGQVNKTPPPCLDSPHPRILGLQARDGTGR